MKTYAIYVPYEKCDTAEIRRGVKFLTFKNFMFMDFMKSYATTLTQPFSLEIIHENQATIMCFTAFEESADFLLSVMYALFPNARIVPVPDPTYNFDGYTKISVGEVRARCNSVVPFRTFEDLQVGSMDPVLSALTRFPATGKFISQIVCQPLKDTALLHCDLAARRLFESFKERITPRYILDRTRLSDKWERIEKKCSDSLFSVNIRFAALLPDNLPEGINSDPEHYVRMMLASYSEMSDPVLNALEIKKCTDDWKALEKFQRRDIVKPFYFSTVELATAWHVPGIADTNNLQKNLFHETPPTKKTLSAEETVTASHIGMNEYRTHKTPILFARKDRDDHLHLLGRAGVGKSKLLEQFIYEDLRHGYGATVFDNQGVLAQSILARIDDSMHQRILCIDLNADTFFPSINPLASIAPEYHLSYAVRLTKLFRIYFGREWSHNVEQLLFYSLFALLKIPGATLAALPMMVENESYRRLLLEDCDEVSLHRFWGEEYPARYQNAHHPVVKNFSQLMKQLFSTTHVRNILSQPHDRCSLSDAIAKDKVVFVVSSSDKIHSAEYVFLQSLFLQKLIFAGNMYADKYPQRDKRHGVYIDRCAEDFLMANLGDVLLARRSGLQLALSSDVLPTSAELRSYIFGCIATHISFRISSSDAQHLGALCESNIEPQNLMDLPNRCFYMKSRQEGRAIEILSGRTIDADEVSDSGLYKTLMQSLAAEISIRREDAEEYAAMWGTQIIPTSRSSDVSSEAEPQLGM